MTPAERSAHRHVKCARPGCGHERHEHMEYMTIWASGPKEETWCGELVCECHAWVEPEPEVKP